MNLKNIIARVAMDEIAWRIAADEPMITPVQALVMEVAKAQKKFAELCNQAGDDTRDALAASFHAERALYQVVFKLKNDEFGKKVADRIIERFKSTRVNMGNLSSRLVERLEEVSGVKLNPTPWEYEEVRYTVLPMR